MILYENWLNQNEKVAWENVLAYLEPVQNLSIRIIQENLENYKTN